ncbi:hypothetical protein [uncultured Cohaesibacter sp.]|uniref:hypothetical protein n=1 Tax=uncultured Cohaesibacter sp. TaxID=1002546 RepID=UPI0029C882CF|nr:hypothetical protein [uncultured Cohaesibacter sp.]
MHSDWVIGIRRDFMTFDEHGLLMFITRPVSAVLLLVALVSILWPYVKPFLAKSRRQVKAP